MTRSADIAQADAAVATAEMPMEKTQSAQQDQWKDYEVKEEKPDWSSYEIPGDGNAHADDSRETESELDAALSGLKEADGTENVKAETPKRSKRTAAGAAEPVNQPAADAAKRDDPAPEDSMEDSADDTSSEGDEETGNDPTWSMEELRRNLTNINDDDR
jgi:hypothetical protein